MLVDSHCHLDSTSDLEAVISRAKSEGVNKIITVGTSIDGSRKALEIAKKYSSGELGIYASVGIHPEDGKNDIAKYGSLLHCFKTLKQLALSSDKIVGIGEAGLDYRLASNQHPATSGQEKAFQKKLFETHIRLAADLDLQLIIHCRNAWNEIFDSISKIQTPNSKLRGVFHSWTGNWQESQKALDLGFYISFSGIVTYKQSLQSSSITLTAGLKQSLRSSASPAGLKNAQNIQEAAKKIALDRILVETDSPFLAPEPFRGAKNEPKNVRIVAQFLADLRNLPFDEIAEATSQNARQLFGISI